jgi:coproporphyrinogen III oxidase-like Fe-S oxidoreductase
MTALDQAEERALMGLRTDEGVALCELALLPMVNLEGLIESGHLLRAGGRLTATPAGRLVLNHVTERLILS